MILIVVKWTIRPEYADAWLERVADFTAATRAEPVTALAACGEDHSTAIKCGNGTTGSLTAGGSVEVTGGQDLTGAAIAADAHVTSDHFKDAMSWMPDYVAKRPDIINTTIPQDGWSEMAEVTPR